MSGFVVGYRGRQNSQGKVAVISSVVVVVVELNSQGMCGLLCLVCLFILLAAFLEDAYHTQPVLHPCRHVR